MDKGYVILLVLGLLYVSAAVFLYVRARRKEPGSDEVPDQPEAS